MVLYQEHSDLQEQELILQTLLINLSFNIIGYYYDII